MNDVRFFLLSLLGAGLDMVKKLRNEESKSCSTVTYLGDKQYKLTVEEVEDGTEV